MVCYDGFEFYLFKKGMFIMGGILILGVIFISILLWVDFLNKYVWVILFVVGLLGVVGFIDDYCKVICKDFKGLIVKWKYFW